MVKSIFKLALLFSLVFLFLQYWDRRPNTNTPEYLEAHGIKKGQENRVLVANTLFRMPSTQDMNVLTYEEIIPGRADVLTLTFLFDDFISGNRELMPSGSNKVRVELYNMEALVKSENLFDDPEEWESIIDKPTLGLTEFRSKYEGGWGTISYQSLPDAITLPMGEAMVFRCNSRPPAMCWGGYQYSQDLRIWFFIPGILMDHWREIYTHIDTTIRSYIME